MLGPIKLSLPRLLFVYPVFDSSHTVTLDNDFPSYITTCYLGEEEVAIFLSSRGGRGGGGVGCTIYVGLPNNLSQEKPLLSTAPHRKLLVLYTT